MSIRRRIYRSGPWRYTVHGDVGTLAAGALVMQESLARRTTPPINRFSDQL